MLEKTEQYPTNWMEQWMTTVIPKQLLEYTLKGRKNVAHEAIYHLPRIKVWLLEAGTNHYGVDLEADNDGDNDDILFYE